MASIATKRPQEGSVYERKDGRWVAQLPVAGKPGKPTQRYARTEDEAIERLRELIDERNAGRRPVGRQLRLGRYLDQWLEDRAEWGERPPLRESTLDQYSSLVKTHIKPELGHVLLADLDRDLIVAALKRIRRKKVRGGREIAPNTVGGVLRCLKSALSTALDEGRIASNPAARIRPISQKVEVLGPTPEQCALILEALRTDKRRENRELYPMFLLIRWSGCRISEARGLRWMDVQPQQGQVIFRKSAAGGELKTEGSVRAMPLPDHVLKAIAGVPRRSLYHVFTTRTGKPLDNRRLQRAFEKALETSGVVPPVGADKEAFSPHTLRHSFATELVQANFSYGWVGDLLGHTNSTQVERRYGHLRSRMGVVTSEIAAFYRHPGLDQAANV